MSNPENNSINTKINDLNTKIQWFYSDDFNLDEAEKRYQEAADLTKEIEQDLTELKNKIEVIDKDFTK